MPAGRHDPRPSQPTARENRLSSTSPRRRGSARWPRCARSGTTTDAGAHRAGHAAAPQTRSRGSTAGHPARRRPGARSNGSSGTRAGDSARSRRTPARCRSPPAAPVARRQPGRAAAPPNHAREVAQQQPAVHPSAIYIGNARQHQESGPTRGHTRGAGACRERLGGWATTSGWSPGLAVVAAGGGRVARERRGGAAPDARAASCRDTRAGRCLAVAAGGPRDRRRAPARWAGCWASG